MEQCPSLTAPAGSVFNGVRVAVNPAGKRIFIGAYPIRTLETNGENAQDGFRSKFVYAVSADLTQVGSVTTTAPAGSIYVRDNPAVATPLTTQAPFVVISTGKNSLNPTAAAGDAENLDNDHIFSAFTGNTESNTNQYYDDTVEFEFPVNSTPQFCISQLDIQDFSTPGTYTWTKPTNGIVQYALIEISGADGGHISSAGASVGCAPAQGGGDGGIARKIIKGNALPSTVNVVVGQGGLGSSGCIGSGGQHFPQNEISGGTVSRFGTFITVSGGNKGVVTGGGGSTNVAGTATGADSFITNPVGTNTGQVSCTWHSSCGSGGSCNDYCSTTAGRGDNARVTITSYLCN